MQAPILNQRRITLQNFNKFDAGEIKMKWEDIIKGKGQKHYTEDGKEWKGKTHKMPDGTLMTENPHNEKSVKLYHKNELPKRRSAFTARD